VEKELDYDFIFAGAGAATLQIIQKLIQSGDFTEKQLLILERDSNKKKRPHMVFLGNQNQYAMVRTYCKRMG
jgi:pyrroline-5-carboxylate reductase